jgi:integrase
LDLTPGFRNGSDALDALFARCEGAYADRTLRSYRADLDLFVAWCEGRAAGWLPAEPADVATFLDGEAARHRFSTVRRRLSAIGFAHRLADLPDPSRHSEVRLALRRAMRRKARRTAQMVGLTHGLRDRILAACPDDLAGRRDAALIAVGYDTLCRSWELASMQVGHLEVDGDGVVSVLIPRSKADIAGDGRLAYLSEPTAALVDRWRFDAGIDDGPLFRGLPGGHLRGGALDTRSIRRLIKRAARRAGLDAATVAGLSGHSMRIGAAQDMLTAGFDLLAIMQAGGWKTPEIVARYVEHAHTRAMHERRWRALGSTAPTLPI